MKFPRATRFFPLSLLLLAGCVSVAPQGSDLKAAARINTELGAQYMKQGNLQLAMEKLNRAIEENPDYAPAHSTLAYLFVQRGDTAQAEKEYRKALSLSPDDPDILNNFGVFLCAHGKPQEALRDFSRAASNLNYATPAAAWSNAGTCALSQNDNDGAEGYFRSALQSDPNFADALAQMAALSYGKHDYLRARAFTERYELVAQHTAKTLWIAAMTEQALGNTAGARDYGTRLKNRFPESTEAENFTLP